MTSQPSTAPDPVPLCFDLDGTLIRADLLQEGISKFLAAEPFSFPLLLLWLKDGRPRVKREVHSRVTIDPADLPYIREVWDLAKRERAAGRKVLLVTAADADQAERVAAYMDCFDEVIGTRGDFNLLGPNKRLRLVERFGERGFDYVGDSKADLRVWPSARRAIVANRSPEFLEQVRPLAPEVIPVGMPSPSYPRLLHYVGRALRHTAPVALVSIIAIPFAGWPPVALAMAFLFANIALCFFDDVVDLPADRKVPSLARRPLVAWRLHILHALGFASVTGALALALGAVATGWVGAMLTATVLIMGAGFGSYHGHSLVLPFVMHVTRMGHFLGFAVGMHVPWWVDVTGWALAFVFVVLDSMRRSHPSRRNPGL